MDPKQIILKRLSNVIKGQAMFIRDDKAITDEEKLEQINVVLELQRFLDNFDESVALLKKSKQSTKSTDDFDGR